MGTYEKKQLEQLVEQIRHFQAAVQKEEGYSLQFTWDKNEKVGWLEGNRAGLLHFCRQILELCQKEFEGAHLHFDEDTDFSEGSDALTIMLNS